MALVLKDRVKETTTTTGTGTVTLAGASTGYQSFSVIGNANTTYYCIAGQGTAEWEVGIGTYTASGTTLSRDTILASSNSGSVVTFSAGTKDVFVVYPAGKSVNLDASNNATALGTVASATLTNATGLPISTGVSGLGTGVATALAVNTGSSGAFVVNGGALGTPSSGTVTNLTGTASININGTVGATTPNTGAFTTLSSTGNTTLGDASTDTVTVNGYMGVGGGGVVGNGLQVVSSALSGVNQTGVYSALVGTSGGTNRVRAFLSFPASAAASYTVNDMSGFWAADVSKGAGSTITNLHGLYIADQTQGTNNFGITSVVSSGANKWNIYASGTANNYFAGNVGIGTSSPSVKLEVNRGSAGSIATFTDGVSTNFNFSTSGTVGTFGTDAGSTSLALKTSGAERMRIDSSGNVGIGTSSPNDKLTVASDNYLSFQTSSTTFNSGRVARIGGVSVGSGNGYLSFETYEGGSGGGERARITSSGNVGIGTSSPASKLDVKGTLRLSGSTSGYVGLAPAAAAGSTTYTLPSADGSSGQVLSTNGTGTLSWATAGGGGFAAGTAMLFVQTAAPTGWTKSTTHDNKALRIVSGAASSGGSVAFTTAFASQGVSGTVGSTTLTTSQIPSHAHTVDSRAGPNKGSGFYAPIIAVTEANTTSSAFNTTSTGGGGSHDHSFTGTAINLAVQYVDVIIATKN